MSGDKAQPMPQSGGALEQNSMDYIAEKLEDNDARLGSIFCQLQEVVERLTGSVPPIGDENALTSFEGRLGQLDQRAINSLTKIEELEALVQRLQANL